MAVFPVLPCLLAYLSLQAFQGVGAIDCYDCVSVAGSNPTCEDEFRQDISTVHLIKRDCFYAFFLATHCFKLKGIREDGTHFIVRRCSDADWGNNCGELRYLFDDKEERIHGCLTSCHYDGCNRASPHLSPSLPLTMAGILAVILWRGVQRQGVCW